VFEGAPASYDRFMGVYSMQLAPQLADFAGVRSGQHVLDVGCGPGALTSELVARLGATNVSAVDPSESFVGAIRERFPGTDVQSAPAEELPFADASFDATLAQLVVHFMSDPVAGLQEMRRVTREAGVVATCVWDLAGGRAPMLTLFWQAARQLDPAIEGESGRPGTSAGQLAELLRAAGLSGIEEAELRASVDYATFDDWWEPVTLGVGPVGTYASRLDDDRRAALRERCRQLLPAPPFTLTAVAWAARGVV
jgi:ubiquinone/menaquinone biosynthesis C-methylase UbiE